MDAPTHGFADVLAFKEGAAAALLVDKGGDPEWNPATPEAVTDELLDELFAPLPGNEEWAPFPEVLS